MSINYSARSGGKIGISFRVSFNMKVYCVVSLEWPHRELRNEFVRYSHGKQAISVRATKQSVPQDQKSVTFSHSVISLDQLLQTSKNTAYIFLTFRNHVKIFLPQNILQNILNVVYRTTLSIRTERTDKQ